MPTSLNASLNVSLNPASLNASTKQIQQALGRITGQASEFQKSLDASTARVFAFGATTVVINGVTQSFKKLVSTTVEVQKRLAEINSIFQATDVTFNRFRNSIFKVAKETGQSFDVVAEGAAELARQGLSAEETAARLKSALILTRISGMDAEKSVKALTAAINGFTSAGLSHTQIVNKMVAVDTAFAVSTDDLAAAFQRAGSTAEDAGVSFNELLGLITAVEQRTSRGGAVIGNAFKSIFTRLQRGTTIEELKALGVQIDATMSGVQKLNALSKAIEGISDPTVVSQIKELAGGVFQINVVSAALKDLGSNTSIFQQAATTAASATNEAFQKNAALNETIASQINALVQGLTSLAERVGSITLGPLLEGLIGITTKVTTFLDNALDPEKGNVFVKGLFKTIGSFLSGPAVVIFTAAFVKIFKLVAKFAAEGMKALFTMGTQAERIKQIEVGIVGLLQKDQNLRNIIASTTATQSQKEQAIISAIQRENALLQQQAQLRRQLAVTAASAGVGGFSQDSGRFLGRRGRGNFATGFMEEEAMARALGAPAGVQAHFGKGRIGGQRFVMNNHEIEIPNFAGGNSAVIPMYAGGNMPRYASAHVEGAAFRRLDRAAFTKQFGALAYNRRARAEQTGMSLQDRDRRLKALKKQRKGEGMEDIFLVRPRSTNVGPATMLVPQIGLSEGIPKGAFGRTKVKGKTVGYEYDQGLPVEGPKVPRAVDQAADPQDEKLEKNITKSVTTEAAKFAALLKPVLGKPSPKVIEKGMRAQGGGAGALAAIVGAAFEASVNAALDISPAKNKEGGDFDVKGVTGRKRTAIDTLFGIKATKASMATYDYKQSYLGGAEASFAKKLINQGAYTMGKRPKGRRKKNFAGGYMPKFAKGAGGAGGAMEGGFGIMMAFGALQMALSTFTSSVDQAGSASAANAEAKIQEIIASDKSFAQKDAEISALHAAVAAQEAAGSGLEGVAEAANKAMTALMAMSALNMITGGIGGRLLGGAAKGIGRGIAGGARAGGRKIAGTSVGKKVSDRIQARHTRLDPLKGQKSIADFRQNEIKKGMAAGLSKKRAVGRANTITNAANEKMLKSQGAASRMGKIGKFAGRAGGVAGVALGGFEIASILGDETLSKRQKTTGVSGVVGGVAGGLGGMKLGAMSGAAIGGLVGGPAAPVTAAVGGVIGGIVGGIAGYFGGRKGAEEIAEFAQGEAPTPEEVIRSQKAEFRNRKLGFGGEGGQEKFASRVQKNLSEMASQGLDTTAIMTEYSASMEALTKINQDEESTAAERADAMDRFIAASKKAAGMTFDHIEDQEAHEAELKAARKELSSATNAYAKALRQLPSFDKAVLAQMRKAGNMGPDLKTQSERANLQAGLVTSKFNKFAGASRLASEQNAMMAEVNFLRQQSSAAKHQQEMQKQGLIDGDPEELKRNVEESGAAFKAAAMKAGQSFLNKMTTVGDLMKDNQREIDAERKRVATAEANRIDDIVKRGGRDYDRMFRDAKQVGDLIIKGGNRTEGETRDLGNLISYFDKQGTKTETDTAIIAYLKTLHVSPEGAKGLIETARAAIEDAYSTAKTKEGKAFMKTMQEADREGSGAVMSTSTKKLITAQNNLEQEYNVTKEMWKNFRENPATKGFANVLSGLKTELDSAAGTLKGLKTFANKNIDMSKSANQFISEAEAFFEEKRTELKNLKGQVTELSGKVASIEAQGGN